MASVVEGVIASRQAKHPIAPLPEAFAFDYLDAKERDAAASSCVRHEVAASAMPPPRDDNLYFASPRSTSTVFVWLNCFSR
jgi:hypothetical protein